MDGDKAGESKREGKVRADAVGRAEREGEVRAGAGGDGDEAAAAAAGVRNLAALRVKKNRTTD